MDTRETTLANIRGVLYDEQPTLEQAINRISDCISETAEANGWHDEGERTPERLILLMVTELTEIYEEFRDGKTPGDLYFKAADQEAGETMDKPEGIAVEIIDVIIRAIETAVSEWHVDVASVLLLKMIYNTTRPYRHGGKTA